MKLMFYFKLKQFLLILGPKINMSVTEKKSMDITYIHTRRRRTKTH